MSRAYKKKITSDINTLTGAFGGTFAAGAEEKMSGADLAQAALAMQNMSTGLNIAADGTKTSLGTAIQASKLATVTADGVNTVTVDSVASLFVGQIIDVRSPSTGTVRVDDRTITAIDTVGRVVTYNGADGSAAIGVNDIVTLSTPISNAALSGADLERVAGDA